MRVLIGAIVLTGAMATPAMAEPIYLECTMDNGSGQQVPWSISADEAAGTINYTHAQGTFQRRAIFTPTEIVMPDDGRVRFLTSVMRISRVDGTFRIESTVEGNPTTVRLGQCRKATAPARAF